MCISIYVSAQQNDSCKIYGQILSKDKKSLVNSTISISGKIGGQGIDSSGRFQINGLKKGKYKLHWSFVEFEAEDKIITVNKNVTFITWVIKMKPDNRPLDYNIIATYNIHKSISLANALTINLHRLVK